MSDQNTTAPDEQPQVDAITSAAPKAAPEEISDVHARWRMAADARAAGMHKVPLDGAHYEQSLQARDAFAQSINYIQNKDVSGYLYASRLNQARVQEAKYLGVDRTALELLAKTHIDTNPVQYRNELLELRKVDQDHLVTDEKVRAAVKQTILTEHYERELEGRPMPQGMLSDPLMMNLSPKELGAVTRFMAVNDVNLAAARGNREEPGWFDAGYTAQFNKTRLHNEYRDGKINDAQLLYESAVNSLENEDPDAGLFETIAGGVAAMGADLQSGFVKRSTDYMASSEDFEATARQFANEVESKSPGWLSNVSGLLGYMAAGELNQAQKDVELGKLLVNMSYAEAEANNLDNINRIVRDNPNVDLATVFRATQHTMETRAVMNSVINFVSILPIGTPLASGVAGGVKLAGRAMSRVPGIKIIPGALAKPAAGLNGIMHNAVRNAVLKRTAAATASRAAVAAPLAAGNIATNAVDSALQATVVEGVTGYGYKADENAITGKTGGEWSAAADTAAEAFVQNLVAGVVMGLPGAAADVARDMRAIQQVQAQQSVIQVQQAGIAKALDEGVKPEVIIAADKHKNNLKDIVIDRVALIDALKESPAAVTQLKAVAADKDSSAAVYAEKLLLDLEDNDLIRHAMRGAGSHEFYIFNAVKMAQLVHKNDELKKVVDNHQKFDRTAKSAADIEKEFNERLSGKIARLAEDDKMFEYGFVAETLDEKKQLEASQTISAEINSALKLPEESRATSTSNEELKHVARRASRLMAENIVTFALKENRDPVEFFRSLNLRFVMGERTYDVKTGKTHSYAEYEHNDQGHTIYLTDKFTGSTLMHEFSHLMVEMLAHSKNKENRDRLSTMVYWYVDRHKSAFQDKHTRFAYDEKTAYNTNDTRATWKAPTAGGPDHPPVNAIDYNALTPEEQRDFQERVAYSTVYSMAYPYLRNAARLNRVLDRLRKQGADIDAIVKSGKLASYLKDSHIKLGFDNTTAEFDEVYNKSAHLRYTEDGYLDASADIGAMMATDIMRHSGLKGGFMRPLRQLFKEEYGSDFTFNGGPNGLGSDAPPFYTLITNSATLNLKMSEMVNTFLSPDDHDLKIIRENFGDKFTDELIQTQQRIRNMLVSIQPEDRSLDNVNRLSEEDIKLLNISDQLFDKYYVTPKMEHFKGALDEAFAQLAEAERRLKTRKTEIEKHRNRRKPQRYTAEEMAELKLLNQEVAAAKKGVNSERRTYKSTIANIYSELGVSPGKHDRRKVMRMDTYAREVDTLVDLRISRLQSAFDLLKKNGIPDDLSRFAARDEIKTLDDSQAVHMFRAYGCLEHIIQSGIKIDSRSISKGSLEPAALKYLQDKGVLNDTTGFTIEELKSRIYGNMDLSESKVEQYLNTGALISADSSAYFTRAANEYYQDLFDFNTTLERHRRTANGLGLRIMADMAYRIYAKTKTQLNRDTLGKIIERNSQELALKVSTRVKPYHFERRSQLYYRKALQALQSANHERAAHFFTHAAALAGAAREVESLNRKLNGRRRTLRNILKRNSSSDTVSKNYNVDTFMAAKQMAYDMGIVDSSTVFKDLANFKTAKTLVVRDADSVDVELCKDLGVDPAALDGRPLNDLANMSFHEALLNMNTIDSLLAISRETARLNKANAISKTDSFVEDLTRAVEQHGLADAGPIDASDPNREKGKANRIRNAMRGMDVSLLRPETVFAMLEQQPNGTLFARMFEPVMDAEQAVLAKSRDNNNKHNLPLLRALDKLNRTGPKLDEPYIITGKREVRRGHTIVQEEIVHKLDGTEGLYNQVAVLMANMGTISNRQAMCRSLGISEQQLTEVINDLTEKGIITNDLWRLVEKHIWQPYEQVYSQTVAAFRDVHGHYFVKEDGLTIRLPDGSTVKGGYAPLTVARGREDIDLPDPEKGDLTALRGVPGADGFTHERTVHTNEITLSIGDMMYSMERQLTYAHMARPVRAAWELLNKKEVKEQLEKFMPESTTVIDNALRSAANLGSSAIETRLAPIFELAKRANTGMLAYNVVNAFMGLSQLAVTAAHIGPKQTAYGLYKWLQGSRSGVSRETIDSVSNVMRNRNFFRGEEFKTTMRRVEKKSIAGKVMDTLEHYAYIMQSAVQSMLDYVTWVGAYSAAYNKRLADGKVPKNINGFDAESIRSADSAVRHTQASRSSANISLYETKDSNAAAIIAPFSSIFISFINTQKIRFAEIDAKYTNKFARAAAKTMVFAFIWCLPTAINELLRSFISGTEDPEKDAALAVAGGLGYAKHPVIGVITNAVSKQIAKTAFGMEVYADRGIFSIPLESIITGPMYSLPKFVNGEADAESWKQMAAPLALTFLGYNQISNTLTYLYHYFNDDYYETGVFDELRGFISGRSSDEQKGK